MIGLELTSTDKIFQVPESIAVCPYCRALLIASVIEWTQEKDGIWTASNTHIECDREPDIDSEEWEDWQYIHDEPLESFDWISMSEKIETWINENYRAIL